MRVLLYAPFPLARSGGVETHVRAVATGLMARGHQVEIFGTPASLPPFHMVSRLEPARYDVVHQHGGVWPHRVPPGPHFVRTFHFSVAAKMRRYLGLGRLRTLANLANWMALADERAATRRARALIAVSGKLADEIARFHGVARERIHVIPNGACFDPPVESRAALRARYGIAQDVPVVLTIGRRDYVKGYDLFEAAWRAARFAKGLWVQVGGRRRMGGRARLLAIGEVSRREAIDWIHAADLAAFPSYYEGGGIVLLDYLAAGLYTLTHDVGNAREVIQQGANGELLHADVRAWIEALERLLASPRPRGASTLPHDYVWDRVVAKVEAVYGETPASG